MLLKGTVYPAEKHAIAVEKGLTVGGKTLVEHLEAINHAKALDTIRKFAHKEYYQITESDIPNDQSDSFAWYR